MLYSTYMACLLYVYTYVSTCIIRVGVRATPLLICTRSAHAQFEHVDFSSVDVDVRAAHEMQAVVR